MGLVLRTAVVGLLAAALTACGTRTGGGGVGSVSPGDAGSAADAGAGSPDSGANTDAGSSPDAGIADAGPGTPDGGAPDGGNPDAGIPPVGPHVLAADEKAEALALDSTNVYWVNEPGPQGSSRFALRTVPKSGGTPTTLAEVDRQVNDLVADDEAVFLSVGICSTWPYNGCPDWTDSIVRVSKSNGARQVLASGSGQLALDDEWVYYQFMPTSAGWPRPPGEIRRVPKTGGPYEALVRFENLDLPALTVFGDTVYWSASEQHDGNGALRAAPKNGGNPVTIVSNNSAYYTRMKADFEFLYLRWFANGAVFRVRRNGADGKWIRGLDGQSGRDDIDANAGVVYWNESRNMQHPGCLGRANSDGTDVRCLDQGDFVVRAVRVDDTAVYYVKNGEIWRVLK